LELRDADVRLRADLTELRLNDLRDGAAEGVVAHQQLEGEWLAILLPDPAVPRGPARLLEQRCCCGRIVWQRLDVLRIERMPGRHGTRRDLTLAVEQCVDDLLAVERQCERAAHAGIIERCTL